MTRQIFWFCICLAGRLLTEEAVSADKNGCDGTFCFIISELKNAEFLTQYNAQQWCRNNNSQLAEISNDGIQRAIANFIGTYGSELNPYAIMTNGKRTLLPRWLWVNGQEIGSISLNQRYASYSYGYLQSSGTGFQVDCAASTDTKSGFICSGVSSCSGTMIGSRCYAWYSNAMSWYDARNRCLESKGDLASFDDITTNDGFKALNVSGIDTQSQYWIGLRKESWTWQGTGAEIKYSQWLSGQPSYYYGYDCLCLQMDYWQPCRCDETRPFICLSEKQSTTVSTSKSPSYSSSTTSSFSSSASSIVSSASNTPTASSVVVRSNDPTPSTVGSTHSTSKAKFIEDNESGLNYDAKVGIGAGIGVGGFLLLGTAIVVTIALIIKRCLPARNRSKEIPNIPDTISHHAVIEDLCSSKEDPYAVVAMSETFNSITDEMKSQTIYQELEFVPKTDAATIPENSETTTTPIQSDPNSESEYSNSCEITTENLESVS